MKSGFQPEQKPRATKPAREADHERGQSLVETAITLPILIIVLVAIIDLSRAFDAYIVITNAVREGARFGSKIASLSEADIADIVVDDILGSGTNVTLMNDFTPANVAVGISTDAVTVTVSYDFGLWFGPIVGLDTVALSKESVMPVMSGP
jgi:Flp pilus assembly protein TadG